MDGNRSEGRGFWGWAARHLGFAARALFEAAGRVIGAALGGFLLGRLAPLLGRLVGA